MSAEWLSSRLKLCQLTVGPNTMTSDLDPVEAALSTQSYPTPDYDQSSIFMTLEAYCGAVEEAQAKRSDLKMGSRDENLKPKPVEADIIHQFAEMLSLETLESTVTKGGGQSRKDRKELHSRIHSNPDKICNMTEPSDVTPQTISAQEKLATMLASEIYGSALEELSEHSGKSVIGEKDAIGNIHSEPCSSMYCCDREEPDMEVDSKIEENECTQTQDRLLQSPGSDVQHSDLIGLYSTLNEMANMGSLDYPDAPPSTPLLPEMIKSRASFTRKLKGGLAKEFLPSPPPPTPKDQQVEPMSEDKMIETASVKSEFMVRLIRSLSVAYSQHGEGDEGQDVIGMDDKGKLHNGISTLSDYASWLSADIINCITTAHPVTSVNTDTSVRGVQLLAHHLAQDIVIMSIKEVMGRKSEEKMSNLMDEMALGLEASMEIPIQTLDDTPLLMSSPVIPDMEMLRDLAGRLITSTLVQAFSEVEKGTSQYPTSQQSPGEASKPEKVQEHNLYLNIAKTQQTTSMGCYNGASQQNVMMPDANWSFAEKIVHEVIKYSMHEASNSLLRCNQITVDSDRLNTADVCLGGPEQTVLRGFISDELCQDTQELQCVLLWVAASHTKTSVLQLDVSDSHIQQQLCSLSLKAQVQEWMVGNLLASLLQYCEDQQTASRGHRKSYRSLLGHLLL